MMSFRRFSCSPVDAEYVIARTREVGTILHDKGNNSVCWVTGHGAKLMQDVDRELLEVLVLCSVTETYTHSIKLHLQATVPQGVLGLS